MGRSVEQKAAPAVAKRLLAYEVREGYEGHCCIRFATNGATARREGALELDVEWENIEHCRRVPDLDQYAPGPVPPMELLERGWWFNCQQCEKTVSLDDENEAIEPTVIGQDVFCCPTCAAQRGAYVRRRIAAKAAACEAIYTRHPQAVIDRVHVYADALIPATGDHGCNAHVTFKLPGMTYGICFEFGANEYRGPECDIAVFRGLAQQSEAAA